MCCLSLVPLPLARLPVVDPPLYSSPLLPPDSPAPRILAFGSAGSSGSRSPPSSTPTKAPVPPPDGLIQFFRDDEEFIDVHMFTTPDRGQPQIHQEPARAAAGDSRALYTSAMATCTTIAIRGVYPEADPSVERYDRFMVHTAEENWWYHFDTLRIRVQEAQDAGLTDLHAHVAAMQPETLLLDGAYKQKDVDDSYEAQRRLMAKLRELVGSDAQSDYQPRIHWYPYRTGFPFEASMALYSDGSVLVNQEGFKCSWQLQEKQWVNYQESSVPEVIPPPDDYRTLVNHPMYVWYANRRKTT
ncbi:hypothetical protein PG984_005058 [Apiospora sp. TS-2023a]